MANASTLTRRALPIVAICGILAAVSGTSLHLDTEIAAENDASFASTEKTVAGLTTSKSIELGTANPVAHSNANDNWTDMMAAAYSEDEVLIAVEGRDILQEIASDLGAEVVRHPGLSGYGALSVPEGMDVRELLTTLNADERVQNALPNGITFGATVDAAALQVHHQEMKTAYGQTNYNYSNIVVAVLDTGVAYENHEDASGAYVQASSLSTNTFVTPYDFINNDAHANDDHQHGTHIASTIASSGSVNGVAPGASVMPVKVLDENNAGTEFALVEGIWHAINNGADVINMSLSFQEGYVPSGALLEAIDAAKAAGIVMVSSTGNEGAEYVSWPAASPAVLAVSSVCFDDSPASYSNKGTGVFISAPGGCLDQDFDGNGYEDGIVAQTISHQSPADVGHWMMAGTSQAAALVTGAVVQVLATGASADYVPQALQHGAAPLPNNTFADGYGVGMVSVEDAVIAAETSAAPAAETFFVSLLPYMERVDADNVAPKAWISVLDANGAPASGVDVYGTINGSTNSAFNCTNLAEGLCVVTGQAAADMVNGESMSLGWTVQVEAVVDNGISSPIESVLFATDGLEVLLAALDDNTDTAGLPLGFVWGETSHNTLGEIAEGFSFVDTGAGLLTIPVGSTFNLTALSEIGSLSEETLDIDGTGLLTIPVGSMTVARIELAGNGLLTIPVGSTFSLVAMDGTGLLTIPVGSSTGAASPLELDALDIYAPAGATADANNVAFNGQPISLTTGSGLLTIPVGSSTEGFILAGGWTINGSYAAATALTGTALIDGEPVTDEMNANSMGALAL